MAQVNSNYCLVPTNQPTWNVIGTGATTTNVFVIGATMPQQLISFDSANGYLSLSFPNPFPGSTLTL